MAISNLPKLNFSVPFAMTAALPVEYNAYFDNYEAAVAAAATADVPSPRRHQHTFCSQRDCLQSAQD